MRYHSILSLLILAAVSAFTPALALAEPQAFLRMNLDMHTAALRRISVDAEERYLLTCSDDKVAMLHDARSGEHLRTYRIPIGQNQEGKVYACALSPDGRQVVLGGWTFIGGGGRTHALYFFDRASGEMTGVLDGFGSAIADLEYSPDGRRLLVCCLVTAGVHLVDPVSRRRLRQLDGYGADSYNAAFARDGRFATASYDGHLRLYDAEGELEKKTKTTGGKKPFSLAFSPDGKQLAVGYNDSPRLQVLDGRSLRVLFEPDRQGADSVDHKLRTVAFSADGRFLYAGGSFKKPQAGGNWWRLIRRWERGGQGTFEDRSASRSGIMDLRPLHDGSLLFGGAQPDAGRFDSGFSKTWYRAGATCNLRSNDKSHFRLGTDALEVGFTPFNRSPLLFSLRERQLTASASSAPAAKTEAGGIHLTDWLNTYEPKLNGRALSFLQQYERCRSAATDGRTLLFGAEWNLYALDGEGKTLWKTPTPGMAAAVNLAPAAGLAAAAVDDGTIRWYRLSDGRELLALYVHPEDQRWLLYTTEGYYDCSPGAEKLAGWHVNRGSSEAPDFFPLSRFASDFYRPDVITKLIELRDIDQALIAANRERNRRDTRQSVLASLPPVVRFLDPGDGAVLESEKLTLRLSLRTPGENPKPVEEVRILLNGRPIDGARALRPVRESAPDQVHEVEVSLPAGEHLLSAQARNANGWSEAVSIRLTRRAPKEEDILKPRLYILAAAVAEYANPDYRLRFPTKDARDFVATMKKQEGKLYREVVVRTLLDKDCSQDSLLDGLEWIQRETTHRDVAMIFLAGHADNDNRGELYYLPHTFNFDRLRSTALRVDEVTDTVSAIVGKVLCFLDTCHSGNLRVEQRRSATFDLTGALIELSSAENGAVVFCSSAGKQFSLESEEWGNGAFSKALVEGLEGQADLIKDGQITINEMEAWIADRVKALTKGRQSPVTTKPNTIPNFPIAVH